MPIKRIDIEREIDTHMHIYIYIYISLSAPGVCAQSAFPVRALLHTRGVERLLWNAARCVFSILSL